MESKSADKEKKKSFLRPRCEIAVKKYKVNIPKCVKSLYHFSVI